MSMRQRTRKASVVLGAAALVVGMAACSSDGGGGGDGDTVEITFLSQNGEPGATAAQELVDAFNAANEDVVVTLEVQPGGTEGDNLMKTKLATGEMADVFHYNSGSLLQALNPDQNLVDLSDQEWADSLVEDMRTVVSTDNGFYGAPWGTTQAGAIMYNKPIYEELGLEVPTDWASFMANNQAILDSGIAAPIIQTYGDTWTSQLFVLGDFANVAAQDPDWAQEYTAHNRFYVDEPALQGFANQQEAHEAGYFNEDFASALYDDGVRMLATGEGAHYPILTSAIGAVRQNYADNIEDVGVFALPAQDAADTRLTVWLPNAMYIPNTTEGDELEAAKRFIAFALSEEGCRIQTDTLGPSGPFATDACTLPDDAPPTLTEVQAYFDAGQTGPALEFLSPIKGPNLEQLTVEVGSGIRPAADAAALYDQDVEKQAQQLGLEGW
ncbi:carbohydrate ABC transporter substrate-binding protein [Occultella glacieicola]|uniref:Carbohydrate ABC transporter substrate-binding protein n=1 Tax=Occultella glacieicola TaxID=2518684 RepID=A0ABY2E495_9MICO|nr:ABC transporter substrate-binding protein [Occultella glacieicola]TDE94023.1 carbohydrate ABC transporter substrate-binding protein [Occultella glacieicola]